MLLYNNYDKVYRVNMKERYNFMIHNAKTILFAACLLIIFTTGCGKQSTQEKELSEFSQSMAEFAIQIQNADEEINEIDIQNVNATQDLLNILDNLAETFYELSEAPVPAHYQGIEDLADEAYENMANAVSFYHSAYETVPFSTEDAQIAFQYYTRAMTRVEYIGYVLTGNVPENENITVYEKSDDSQIVNKILQTEKN